ncbi:MAG: hypothetical protein M1426_02900 [Patescibacteria group bacterium]|nr:hypothetical protein [Patescibacteria group bacterium]
MIGRECYSSYDYLFTREVKTPAEDVLATSTAPIDARCLSERARVNFEAFADLFKSHALHSGAMSVGEVEAIRDQKRGLSGILVAFEAQGQIENNAEGLVTMIIFPRMNKQGITGSTYKATVIDKKTRNFVTDERAEAALRRLKLKENISERYPGADVSFDEEVKFERVLEKIDENVWSILENVPYRELRLDHGWKIGLDGLPRVTIFNTVAVHENKAA